MSKVGQAGARRFSSIVLIVIIVVLALSLTALYQAWEAIQAGDLTGGYYLLIGFVGLALSTYMLLQTRRRIKRFTLETPPITTIIVCPKCEFKNVRNFERGDYILKDLGTCSKCEGTMMITAIYREVPEKRKEEKLYP
ncbi:MAG: hypothetical protein JSV64_08420 [Candidatus Bathyarchaeota archaeon]|nr:MAG: hypothetical protein JSV64_08420 [Candidatus Bathyarchaeota archaeon]